MATTGSDVLSWFEVPRPLIKPALRALRLGNTALDSLSDVSKVATDLRLRGSIVVTGADETSSLRTSQMTKLGYRIWETCSDWTSIPPIKTPASYW